MLKSWELIIGTFIIFFFLDNRRSYLFFFNVVWKCSSHLLLFTPFWFSFLLSTAYFFSWLLILAFIVQYHFNSLLLVLLYLSYFLILLISKILVIYPLSFLPILLSFTTSILSLVLLLLYFNFVSLSRSFFSTVSLLPFTPSLATLFLHGSHSNFQIPSLKPNCSSTSVPFLLHTSSSYHLLSMVLLLLLTNDVLNSLVVFFSHFLISILFAHDPVFGL